MVFIVKQIETNDLIHFGQLKQCVREKELYQQEMSEIEKKKNDKNREQVNKTKLKDRAWNVKDGLERRMKRIK